MCRLQRSRRPKTTERRTEEDRGHRSRRASTKPSSEDDGEHAAPCWAWTARMLLQRSRRPKTTESTVPLRGLRALLELQRSRRPKTTESEPCPSAVSDVAPLQ